MDDLQWADDASLDLIESLISDSKNSNTLFVGCYRSDEVSPDHPLCKRLKGLGQRCNGGIDENVSELAFEDMDVLALNALVSDATHTLRRLTLPLSKVLHQKTNGNLQFAVQFLQSLKDENILTYSSYGRRWYWDEDELRTRNISENVVAFMTGKIKKLSKETQTVLKMAAFVGGSFQEATLNLIIDAKIDRDVVDNQVNVDDDDNNTDIGNTESTSSSSLSSHYQRHNETSEHDHQDNTGISCQVVLEQEQPNVDLSAVLDELENVGFIGRAGIGQTARYKFSHDRVQQAAYSLVPKDKRSLWHFRVGLAFYDDAKKSRSSDNNDGTEMSCDLSEQSTNNNDETNENIAKRLFVIVDQLNLGVSCLKTKKEEIKLAKLNLRAGERAIELSAFSPAATYVKTGIGLLGRELRWSEGLYDITLRLVNALAASELVNGNFDETERSTRIIFQRAESLLDKFPAYICFVKCLIAKGKLHDAIDTGFDVLSKLGETFPKSATTAVIVRDVLRTKIALRGKTDDKLCNLSLMEDPAKIAAMQMLDLLTSCCYVARPEFNALICFRMVRLSLKYGLCNESSFAFALYGFLLTGILNEPREGHRYGQISLSILERLDAKESLARVYGFVYYFNIQWTTPLSSTLDPFLHASRVAMEVGDLEYAMYNLVNYSSHAFQYGRPLAPLLEEMVSYCRQMEDHNQDIPHAISLPFVQCVLNLLGHSEDPTRLRGDAMNDEHLMEEAQKTGNGTVANLIIFSRMMLSYIFGHNKAAADVARANHDSFLKSMPGMFVVANFVFYDGLIACALIRDLEDFGEVESKGGLSLSTIGSGVVYNLNKKKVSKIKKKSLKQLKKWSQHAHHNIRHKYLLLKAEEISLKNTKTGDHAKLAYDAAINASNESSFLQEEALAYERAAMYFINVVNNKKLGSYYISRAHQLYLAWGAKAKADHILAKYYSHIANEKNSESFRIFVQNRPSTVRQGDMNITCLEKAVVEQN